MWPVTLLPWHDIDKTAASKIMSSLCPKHATDASEAFVSFPVVKECAICNHSTIGIPETAHSARLLLLSSLISLELGVHQVFARLNCCYFSGCERPCSRLETKRTVSVFDVKYYKKSNFAASRPVLSVFALISHTRWSILCLSCTACFHSAVGFFIEVFACCPCVL